MGTNTNHGKALDLFIDASKQNHILAQCYVGTCYVYEKGERLAFEYLEKVANKDFTAGQLNLGYLYKNGIGVETDLKRATYWYKKAANLKNFRSQFILACLYMHRDYKDKEIYWYEKSAGQGYLYAQYKL